MQVHKAMHTLKLLIMHPATRHRPLEIWHMDACLIFYGIFINVLAITTVNKIKMLAEKIINYGTVLEVGTRLRVHVTAYSE